MLGVHLTPPLLRAEAENHGNRVTVSVSPDFLHLAIETTRTTSSVSHDNEETTSCITLFRQTVLRHKPIYCLKSILSIPSIYSKMKSRLQVHDYSFATK